MHKYNNQDHSMLTAMMAVWNMEGAAHDIWAVNSDFDYHENSGSTSASRRHGGRGPVMCPMRAILTYHSIDASGSPISCAPDAFGRHVSWRLRDECE